MYRTSPEEIYVGSTKTIPKSGFRKNLLPEIKLRFNKSRFDLGKISKSDDAVEVLKKILGRRIETQEFMTAIFLDRSNNAIGFYRHTVGTVNASLVDLKMITGLASKLLASGIIMCHNHPSGNLKPSDADTRITGKLRDALKLLDITLLDHIIITRDGHTSLAEQGILGTGSPQRIRTEFDNVMG